MSSGPRSLVKATSLNINRPERIDNLLLKMPSGYDDFEVDNSIIVCDAKKRTSHFAEEIFYVDGACRRNRKPDCQASWTVCAEYGSNIEASGYVDANPSNQSAELTAAIKACEIAKSKGLKTITIVTDSKYLFSAATIWIDKWNVNEWKDNKNKPVINVKLFKDLLCVKQRLDIEWLHVKGHSNHQGNIRADTLARSLLDDKKAKLCAISTTDLDLQTDNEEVEDLKDQICRGEANADHQQLDLLY